MPGYTYHGTSDADVQEARLRTTREKLGFVKKVAGGWAYRQTESDHWQYGPKMKHEAGDMLLAARGERMTEAEGREKLVWLAGAVIDDVDATEADRDQMRNLLTDLDGDVPVAEAVTGPRLAVLRWNAVEAWKELAEAMGWEPGP